MSGTHKLFWLIMPFAFLTAVVPQSAFAQDTTSDDLEELFSAEEAVQAPEADTADLEKGIKSSVQSTDVKDLSDLAKLAPFKDVAVIQKRYLPKTQRFEVFGGGTGVLNDAFFLGLGGVGRFGYYLQERWGIEAMAIMLNTSEKQITSDLRSKRGVYTQSLVTTKNYYGLDLKWTPVYGKMTWANRRITPFDLYFSLGGGLTSTNQGGSEPTLHLGTGQIFAMSKAMAFRWDFSWNFFMAESKVATKKESSLYNNLFLTVGVSFFFPEATYR